MDKESLAKELQTLSIGAASVFHKFMHIASDFAKSNDDSKTHTKPSALTRRESTLDSIESFDSNDENDDLPHTGRNKPQISCKQS